MQAWAKHHGCYETVESGQTDDAMAYLTGSAPRAVDTGPDGWPSAVGRLCVLTGARGPLWPLLRRRCQGCLRLGRALDAVPWMRQPSRACAV